MVATTLPRHSVLAEPDGDPAEGLPGEECAQEQAVVMKIQSDLARVGPWLDRKTVTKHPRAAAPLIPDDRTNRGNV